MIQACKMNLTNLEWWLVQLFLELLTDFIRCILWNGIAKRAKEYCKKGDIVCVRGRLQIRTYENEENVKKFMTEVIVESLAFVSSYHKDKVVSESKDDVLEQENDYKDI